MCDRHRFFGLRMCNEFLLGVWSATLAMWCGRDAVGRGESPRPCILGTAVIDHLSLTCKINKTGYSYKGQINRPLLSCMCAFVMIDLALQFPVYTILMDIF